MADFRRDYSGRKPVMRSRSQGSDRPTHPSPSQAQADSRSPAAVESRQRADGSPRVTDGKPSAATTLRHLLEHNPDLTVARINADRDLDAAVRAISLPDTGPGLGAGSDSLHLGVLTATNSRDLAALVDACATVGAAGLIVRRGSTSSALIESLTIGSRLPVLFASDSISWPSLFTRLNTCLGALTVLPGLSELDVPLGDLFALSNAIASLVGGSTAIEDAQRNVIAYSTIAGQKLDEVREQGILGRHVPDFEGNDAQYQAMWRSEHAIRVVSGYPGHLPRLCVAIRVGSEPLGSLWVIESDEGRSGEALQVLDQAARVAAMHLMRLRGELITARQNRAGLVLAVLDGSADAGSIRQLSMDPRHHFGVISYAIPTGTPEIFTERIANLVQFSGREPGTAIAQTLHNHVLVTLLSDPRHLDRDRLEAMARGAIRRAHSATGIALRAAYQRADALDRISKAARDTIQALDLLGFNDPPGNVVCCEDLRAQLWLAALKDTIGGSASPYSEKIDEIARHDAKYGTRYLETLGAVLSGRRDAARISTQLHIHRNSVRYRQERLTKLFAVNFDDADERLALWLALRLTVL